ncbi:MAG: hypothetical protein AAF802_06885 [Planctomycetota bacterium]
MPRRELPQRKIFVREKASVWRNPDRQTRWVLSLLLAITFLGLSVDQQTYAQGSLDPLGQSLDVPQTRLAPLGGSVGLNQINPPFNSAQNAIGSTPGFGNPVPGLGVPSVSGPSMVAPPGQAAQFDPYAGGPAAGMIGPSTTFPAPSSPGLFGGLLSSGPPSGFFAPASPSLSGPTLNGPIYGGLANQPPPVIGSGTLGGGVWQGGAPLGGSLGGPAVIVPPGGYGGSTFGGPGVVANPYTIPQTGLPEAAPSTLFPGGLFAPTSSFNPNFNPYRLIQRARFRHTFLFGGDDADDLESNDTDVALAFAFPRFLFSQQPLFVIPAFSLHLWDGPNASTGADLPANAYSAFLGFAWQSDPNQIVGAELAVDVGVFSEFDIARSDSIRVRGKALGTFRLTPATTFKLGAYYYDRVRVKLLPAGGIFWRPNPFTKVDLFFPQPKFSRFISTVGTQDVWWYLSGEYGGGSWTIDRDDGREDQVDINDVRVLLGLEWGRSDLIRNGQRTWFFEFGYVGDRELVYRNNRADSRGLDDSWLFRLGIGY